MAKKLITLIGCLFVYCATATIVGAKDNRLSYNDYIAQGFGGNNDEFAKNFSAAGRLTCPDFTASASIVGRSDVLVFSAHSAYKADKRTGRCVRRADLDECYFQPMRSGDPSKNKYFMDVSTLRIGSDYNCAGEMAQAPHDWAVARLSASIPNVRPFKPINAMEWGNAALLFQPVLVFAAQSEGWKPYLTPTVCDDTLQHLWSYESKRPAHVIMHLGCSASGGNSGGAVLIRPLNYPDWLFAGVIVGTGEYTVGAYLEGEFREALEAEINSR